jgi:hypothetical protein
MAPASPKPAPLPTSRYKLPGFGLPVNFRTENQFKSALDSLDLWDGYVQWVFASLMLRLA